MFIDMRTFIYVSNYATLQTVAVAGTSSNGRYFNSLAAGSTSECGAHSVASRSRMGQLDTQAKRLPLGAGSQIELAREMVRARVRSRKRVTF